MEQFCKAVVDFLQSEYNDSYSFTVERRMPLPPSLRGYGTEEKVELVIKVSPYYKLTIVDDSMHYLYRLYLSGEYIEERKQYLWQKELIDMIEGS